MPDKNNDRMFRCPQCNQAVYEWDEREHIRFAHPLPRVKEDRRQTKHVEFGPLFSLTPSPNTKPKGR